MGSNMPRGDKAGSANLISGREWYRHGIGFVSNVDVDNHIDSRNRELSLYEVLNDGIENSKLLGTGWNGNTFKFVVIIQMNPL
jgi:cyanophycinase-like exopeptidase